MSDSPSPSDPAAQISRSPKSFPASEKYVTCIFLHSFGRYPSRHSLVARKETVKVAIGHIPSGYRITDRRPRGAGRRPRGLEWRPRTLEWRPRGLARRPRGLDRCPLAHPHHIHDLTHRPRCPDRRRPRGTESETASAARGPSAARGRPAAGPAAGREGGGRRRGPQAPKCILMGNARNM